MQMVKNNNKIKSSVEDFTWYLNSIPMMQFSAHQLSSITSPTSTQHYNK